MAYTFNDKIKDLVPYDPICGDFKIRLDANESYYNFPDDIKNEISKEIKTIDFNRYPDPYCKELCKSVSEFYGIDTSLLTIGNGSDELIGVIVNSFLQKGDSIITLVPDFSMYGFYAALSEVKNITVQKNDDLTVNINGILDIVKEKNAKMIIFSNPCNPTSLGVSKEDVITLVKSVDALVVIDEAYMDFWDQSVACEVQNFDNLIVLKTASKALGAAAIRLGVAISNKKITSALKAVKSPYNVNSVTQAIGQIIYRNKAQIHSIIGKILQNRDFLFNEICSLQQKYPDKFLVYRPNTNFVFIKFSDVSESKDIFEYLKDCGIVIRFMGKYLRITVGNKAECDALLDEFSKKIKMMYGE